MNTPARTAHLAQAADAACRVLEAERAALAEIELCRHHALQLVADSRVRAQLVRERAEARIERVRARMTAAAAARRARICGQAAALAGDQGADPAVLASLDQAIARVIEEIAGASESG